MSFHGKKSRTHRCQLRAERLNIRSREPNKTQQLQAPSEIALSLLSALCNIYVRSSNLNRVYSTTQMKEPILIYRATCDCFSVTCRAAHGTELCCVLRRPGALWGFLKSMWRSSSASLSFPFLYYQMRNNSVVAQYCWSV